MAKQVSSILIMLLSAILVNLSVGCSDSSETEEQKTVKSAGEQEIIKEEDNRKVILFFGNSLTAGYGLEHHEAFPALVQERIDSLGYPYSVINGGLSGETTSGGLNRIDWVLRQNIDLFILELGGNDMLRGIDPTTSKENLRQIILTVKNKFPNIPIIIAGMLAPPNMGTKFVSQFEGMYSELAEEFSAGFIPFLLEGVGGIPALNLADGKHPNVEGQHIVLENVWQVLKKYVEPK